MADNITTQTTVSTVPANTVIRTDDLGAAGHVAYVKLMDGTDGGSTVIAGDANGLDVDVVRLPALPAGDNNIGNVDLASAIPAGTNNIGDVDVASLPAYTTPASGELAGATSATQLPNVACTIAYLKASYDNAGRVYLGGAAVTVANGSTDTTTGIQLSAGDEIILPISNLNILYRICDNAGDDLTYLVLA